MVIRVFLVGILLLTAPGVQGAQPDSTGWIAVPVSSDSLVVMNGVGNPMWTRGNERKWLAAGATVVSGAAAIMLKEQANRSYRRYRTTLDGNAYQETRANDRWAAGALILLQVSVTWLIVEFLQPPGGQ